MRTPVKKQTKKTAGPRKPLGAKALVEKVVTAKKKPIVKKEEPLVPDGTKKTVKKTKRNYEFKSDIWSNSLHFLLDGEIKHTCALTIQGTNISCGVRQMIGILDLASVFGNIVLPLPEKRDLFREALADYIAAIKEGEHGDEEDYDGCAWILASCYKDSSYSNLHEIIQILDELANCSSTYAENPNSNNDIKVWTL